MEAFVRGLPKAELHLHIEGTLEPEMMFDFAGRNGVTLPFASVEEVRAAYRFTDLQSFLDIYYQAAGVLRTEQDFYDLTRAYLDRAHADGVRHAEIFFDPQTHTDRGIDFETVISGIHHALVDAGRDHGTTSALIMCFLRHLSAEAAMFTLGRALNFVEWITAVGLDSGEVGNPPERFAAVFARAREEGFLTVAHAGEEGPPAYVRGALDALGALRIDHGVRALEDPDLVRRLVAEQIPLTVCPLSNLRLRGVETLEDHPLRRMMDAGLLVTVNSDDPAYFGGYVADNYLAVHRALDLGRDHLVTLARNSIAASFLGDTEKAALQDEITAYVAAHGRPPVTGSLG
jgi:adenine deaminase